jgi:DNA-binding transcriptional LysR family regulator
MDVHVRDLRYFIAVAEELSFTRAATERLFISQPALSKQIRQLETSLRVALFRRDRRRVTLTSAGEALLSRARMMIEEWDAAQREIADAAAVEAATVVVGFQTSIARGIVPAVTAQMTELLPTCRLVLRQVPWGDPTAGLGDHTVDAAVAWLPVPAGFSHTVIATEERWVALPIDHRLARRRIVPFRAIADEPFVALPSTAGALRDFWLAVDQRASPARIATEVTSAEETFEAVASGLGVALVSSGNTELYKRGDVAFRPVSGLPPSELAVVWRPGDHRLTVRAFLGACASLASTT